MRYREALVLLIALAVLFVAGCHGGDEAVVGDLQPTCDPEAARLPTADAALAEVRSNLTCGGKPIHPGLVCEFMAWQSDDLPTTVAVDILPSIGSDEYYEDDVRLRAGWTECDLREEPSAVGVRPSFGYQRRGVLADGTQVLRTYYSGGGSGIFMDLVFVRFETEKAFDYEMKPYTRLLMKLVCDYDLGDRDDGTVQVLSDRVVVGPSKHRDKEVVLKPE
jgi:hypothetical protein